jgi:hypothetical protein
MQAPPGDEERELMDPEAREWERPIEGVTADDSGIILSIRSTSDEYGHLIGAAPARAISTHEIIRQAALARLPQEAPA